MKRTLSGEPNPSAWAALATIVYGEQQMEAEGLGQSKKVAKQVSLMVQKVKVKLIGSNCEHRMTKSLSSWAHFM